MAIQAKVTTIQGVSLDQAYINISNPQITKTKIEGVNVYTIGGNASVWASKEYYDSEVQPKVPVESFSVVCELDLTQNPIEQLYAALKVNERLSEVVDCLNETI